MEKQQDERRKRFFPSVSLGSVIATLAFIGSGVGVYTQVIADVNQSKTEIANLKADKVQKESVDRESRQEIRQEIREVKGDVKDIRNDVQRILYELNRIPKPPAERPR